MIEFWASSYIQMACRPWAKVWARGTRRITKEENTHLRFIRFIQIQADPQSAVKIRSLTRRIQSRTLDLAVPTPSLTAPNRLLSTQSFLTNLDITLCLVSCGLGCGERSETSCIIPLIFCRKEGIKAPLLSEKLVRILGHTTRWCLTRMPPSAVENMGPPALSERIRWDLHSWLWGF